MNTDSITAKAILDKLRDVETIKKDIADFESFLSSKKTQLANMIIELAKILNCNETYYSVEEHAIKYLGQHTYNQNK